MTVRALTPDGDIVTSGQHFVTEQQEIGQTIQTRLQLFLGEYFRDITEGTDWFGKVFTKQGTIEITNATIKQRIRLTDGVQRVLSFDTDFDVTTRGYTVNSQVLTIFGEIPIYLEQISPTHGIQAVSI